MIAVKSLSRNYGDFKAVDDVSFEISKGEVVGLLGHNGAGKTTIMKMLTGYIEPTDGEIEMLDVSLADNLEYVRERIGYLPENSPTYPEMSVAEYLEFVAELKGVEKSQRMRQVKKVIERTDLHEKALSPISSLSRGYKQRVGVAQALLNEPSIIILDEPTNGLDPTQVQHMRALIRELAKTSTVILSTHILQEVQAVCDRVIIIRQGKLALDKKLDELGATDSILVTVDASITKLKEKFWGHSAISNIEEIGLKDGHSHYRLTVSQGNITKTLPEISKACVEAGWNLYGIQPQVQTIESIFEEINNTSNDGTFETLDEEEAA